jgi:hypothetical protein
LTLNPNDYWRPDIYEKNSAINIKNVEYTISDIKIELKKVLICGRGESSHPDFRPRFSTPTTNIESDFYVTVDHDPKYIQYITRKGNYALALIVDPAVPKKILKLGGKIFWFAPEYLDLNIPKITIGKFPRGNSGLATMMISSFLGAKNILLSGIKLTLDYSQFLEGKEIVFEKIRSNHTKLYSLDGILCEQISFEDWCKL